MSLDNTNSDIIDLTHLKWREEHEITETPAMFYTTNINYDTRYYYKMSLFVQESDCLFGNESFNEIVAMNIANLLGIECLQYELIQCRVQIYNKEAVVFATKSKDFCMKDMKKISFHEFYNSHKNNDESPLKFLLARGYNNYVSGMFLLDWIINNRDRHGTNIEVLVSNERYRFAPLFDQGTSLLFSCFTIKDLLEYNYLEDLIANNNFIGSPILSENLAYVLPEHREKLFHTSFTKDVIFKGLENAKDAVPKEYWDCVSEMVRQRVNYARRYFLEHPYNPN